MIDPEELEEEEQAEEEASAEESDPVDDESAEFVDAETDLESDPEAALEEDEPMPEYIAAEDAETELEAGPEDDPEADGLAAEGIPASGDDPDAGSEEAAELAADIALGAVAVGGVALLGEVNARQADREARKREQEEARKAREEERARLAEERRQMAAEKASAADEARANRPRPTFGDGYAPRESSAPPPARTFAAPPPAAEASSAPPSDSDGPVAAGDGASAAPAAPVERPVRAPAARTPAAASGGDRAEREAARQAMLEERKAAEAAKKAEREAALQERAAQRQASLGERAAGRGEAAAKHASDFSDLRGTPAAPAPGGNSALAERMAKLAAGGGGMAQALTSKLAAAKADSAPGPAATVARAGAAPAAPPPPGSNDYLDIIQHLEARAAVHEEYDEIKQRYEGRLLVGGEILQCTLVGLNAGLIDSVYRKLSEIPDFLARVEWKYIAIEPVLVVSEGGSKREIRIDPRNPVTIGRDASNMVQVGASFVSRNHAEIRNKVVNPHMPPKWMYHDLGSTHGTMINGVPVRDATAFGPEDRIELGRGYAAIDYPTLQLINRAIPYGREDLNRMVVEVDLVIAVVEADREFEGQASLLRNLSDAQKMGGLLVLAVSKSGPIDESMDVNLDDLRHAARVVKGTEKSRYLAAIAEEDIHAYASAEEPAEDEAEGEDEGGEGEASTVDKFAKLKAALEGKVAAKQQSNWLQGVCKFIDEFRQQSHATVIEKRKKITREEVVNSIRDTGTRLEAKLNKQLEEAERNLQRVSDEISMAPRNLGAAETLRDDTFKSLKQTLDDDTNFFSDPLRPDSLTYFAERLAKQLVVVRKGKTRLELFLVEPHSQQLPHRWINGELSTLAKRHFDQLLSQVTGPQKDPHGIMGLYQSMRELLGGHDKLRNTDLFSDDNYQRYALNDLSRQLDSALSTNFVEYEAVTSTKIDNIIMFVITKTRFAVMFYMSMFSIIGVIVGSTRGKLNTAVQAFFGGKFYFVALPILAVVIWLTIKSYRVNVQDVIDEESGKLRDQLTKHYQAVAKKFVDDAKRVFTIHLSTQESKMKQDMSTLGSSRMSDAIATRNNPVLDQVKKERDDIQAMVYAIGQERGWAESAAKQYTPSPFVQTAPARRTPLR